MYIGKLKKSLKPLLKSRTSLFNFLIKVDVLFRVLPA